MQSQYTRCRHLGTVIPFKSCRTQYHSYQAFSLQQHKPKEASTSPTLSSAKGSARKQHPGVAQDVSPDREDFKEQNDASQLFQTFADSQKHYDRYGGRNLFRYTYKQTSQHFNASNADLSSIDDRLLVKYMAEYPDRMLFRKFYEIAHLRRNYARAIRSTKRTDQSAAGLRGEGLSTRPPRFPRNAGREDGKLKEARRQNPYTSRSSQLMREETNRVMQSAPWPLKLHFTLSPNAQVKEQLRVLMRWLKLSEMDKLSPKPLLKLGEREDLKHALEETHRLKLYYRKNILLCKAVCFVFVCGFIAWKAGSDLIERLHDSKRQATLEKV